ncbi:ATP-binding cassette domain-containing protein [Oerskovia sp. M15]
MLEGIDLDIAQGEFVCLLGASGCGKSTLLNIVAGLERPTTGTWRSPGRCGPDVPGVCAVPLAHREPQHRARAEVPRCPRTERRERAAELLSLVRLDGSGDKRVHELSGGMRQRVALARSLAQERDVLLMDEPFAALDAITRDLLHDELERVWEQTGRTIVFITHNVREAVRLGQRVLLMSSRPGRIVREWNVDVYGENEQRSIEAAAASRLATEITNDLREEIRRHAV